MAQPANGGTTGGTATAYTITTKPAPSSLVDKIGAVFTVHVDSGTNPTLQWGTLVAKPIKKPNGNAATLKKDGVYTVRYNATTGNFILQGEGASGNATASDLLSGKTASTDAGDIIGTIPITNPSYGDQLESFQTTVGANSYGVANNYAYLKVPANTYLNNINWIFHYEPDLLASNILNGKSVFGVIGTLAGLNSVSSSSSNLLIANDTEVKLDAYSWAKFKEIQVKISGTVYVYYSSYLYFTQKYSTGTVYSAIYKNGVAVGTQRSASYTTMSDKGDSYPGNASGEWYETIPVNAGDYLQIYAYSNIGNITIRNFRLYVAENIRNIFATAIS